MSDGLFLSINEASDRLGVNPETIRRRIRRGQIRAQLIKSPHGGDHYRIPLSELNTQDAEIVVAKQLPAPVMEQFNASIQHVVAPLQAQVEAQWQIMQKQAEIMHAQSEEITALRQQIAQQTVETNTALADVSKAIKDASDAQAERDKRGLFARLFGK